MLRTEGSQERLDNLAELKQSVYEYETTCGEECTLEHYLSHVALFTNTDSLDRYAGALSEPRGSLYQHRQSGQQRKGEADDRPRS